MSERIINHFIYYLITVRSLLRICWVLQWCYDVECLEICVLEMFCCCHFLHCCSHCCCFCNCLSYIQHRLREYYFSCVMLDATIAPLFFQISDIIALQYSLLLPFVVIIIAAYLFVAFYLHFLTGMSLFCFIIMVIAHVELR